LRFFRKLIPNIIGKPGTLFAAISMFSNLMSDPSIETDFAIKILATVSPVTVLKVTLCPLDGVTAPNLYSWVLTE